MKGGNLFFFYDITLKSQEILSEKYVYNVGVYINRR